MEARAFPPEEPVLPDDAPPAPPAPPAPAAHPPLLVHVVDDDEAVLDSLCWLLESDGHRCTRSASAEEMLGALKEAEAEPGAEPACLVTDLSLPGLSGLELFRELWGSGRRLPTLIVTGHGSVPTAVAALSEGCAGFLQKPYGDADLLSRVRSMAAEPAPTPPRAAVAGRVAALSRREREVLGHVVGGRTNREIAGDLGVKQKTVEAHRSRVMEKMQAGSLAELVRMAVLLGL